MSDLSPHSRSHILILPYYCDAEVDRYMRIADCLERLGSQPIKYECLLAASRQIGVNQVLHDRFAKVAPTTSFVCPSPGFGYPQGPTAMFWDCMDYIAESTNEAPGFSLWLESDMVIVKNDWLVRLDAEWAEYCRAGPILIMGNVIPDIYDRRLFWRSKLLLKQHANGGACYAKDFSRRMVAAPRSGVFDVAIYQCARALDAVRDTGSICFSTIENACRDVMDPGKVVLHGYMQDKDLFVARCTAQVSARNEPRQRFLRPATWCETVRLRIRSQIVRKSVLQKVLLAQQQKRTASARRTNAQTHRRAWLSDQVV